VQEYQHLVQQPGFTEEYDRYQAHVTAYATTHFSDGSEQIKAFRTTYPRFIELHEHDTHVQEYVHLLHRCAEIEQRIRMLHVGLQGGSVSLMSVMAQGPQIPFRPLMSSAYFGLRHVRSEFVRRLDNLFSEHYPAFGAPIELWIVSSMCGGTGQGISYHVAEYAREFFKQKGFDYIVVQFVRLGSVPYTRYGIQNTVLENCAMATLHDTAIAYGARPPIQVSALLHEKAPVHHIYAQYNFYYLELDDYVNQDRNQMNDSQWQALLASAEKKRSADLTSALRTITQPVVQHSFNVAFVNVRPGWHRAMYVRNGVWESDEDLYNQTAQQVRVVLDAELLFPDYARLDREYVHRIDINAALGDWMVGASLDEQVEPKQFQAWNQNRPKALKLPQPLGSISTFVESSKWEADQREMTRVVHTYLGEKTVARFAVDLQLAEANMGAFHRVQFVSEIANPRTEQYIEDVRLAHRAVAKIEHILGEQSVDGEGSFTQLYALWQALVPGLFETHKSYTERLRDTIKPFVRALVTVQTLLKLRDEALQRIDHARAWLSPLRTQLEVDLAREGIRPLLTNIRAIHAPFSEGCTWLAAMVESQARILHDPTQRQYRHTVVWGAYALNVLGVKCVLGLPTQANDSDIANELAQHCGRTTEGIWWQNQVPGSELWPMSDFRFVIFPPIDDGLLHRIHNARLDSNLQLPQIIVADDANLGLKILALQTYRGSASWFPQGSVGVSSHFYQPLVSYLVPRAGKSHADYTYRVCMASTGHPIFTSDHVHAVTQGALRGLFNEVSE